MERVTPHRVLAAIKAHGVEPRQQDHQLEKPFVFNPGSFLMLGFLRVVARLTLPWRDCHDAAWILASGGSGAIVAACK